MYRVGGSTVSERTDSRASRHALVGGAQGRR